MKVYYNEIDAYCAQWLRNLMAGGLIPHGDVDERSIADVSPGDLAGYGQLHWFAGLGGWPYALGLAGWNGPVWTGSCPCQPFSTAGKGQGGADERHLWPHWFRLIRECKPPVVFGEQVARAIGQGWLDAISVDLESEGYAVGASVLPACAVSAPHIRERLWFVADAHQVHVHGSRDIGARGRPELADGGGDVADARAPGLPLSQRQAVLGERRGQEGRAVTERGGWPPEPDLPRVAHGVSARIPQLRAIGNAIVPALAAEFVSAYMEARP